MDAIYQFIVLRWFYLGEALVTAFVLAVLPYLLIRGPTARIARRWNRRGAANITKHSEGEKQKMKVYRPMKKSGRW